jgi:nucleoside-diphosphate-sugar epimerase
LDTVKRVLVTGGSGFIGRHCLTALKSRGFEIHAVSSQPISRSSDGILWHQANLLESGGAERLLAEVRPSHLLHLAWFVVPGKLISAAENFDWVRSSMELLHAFAAHGGKRATVCGSGYEYDWNFGYCSEKLTPAVPDTVYGACKQALNLLAQSFASQSGISLAWGRVFFLYGPHEHPQRLVSSVIRSLLRNEPAKCSHGRQIRDYMHVQDVADGLVALLDSSVTGSVNVSSAQATTLREIVLTIGRLTGKPELIQLGAIAARPNDVHLVVGDNARIRTEVGWQPKYELEDGLRQTIEWWKEQK